MSTQPDVMNTKPADASQTPYLDDVLHDDWLKSKQPDPINPGDQLSYLWSFGPGGEYTLPVQKNLAGVLNKRYGVSLQPATLTATLTFAQLQKLVGAA